MNDRKDLLDSLAIDRSKAAQKDRGRWRIYTAVVIVLLVTGIGAYWIMQGDTVVTPIETTQQQTTESGSDNAPGQTLEQQNQAGPDTTSTTAEDARVLSASGYITARRMATISAEITGRVTDVMVEEGMAVEKGQVVARLDNSLALVDLSLAQAQKKAATATLAATQANLDEAQRVLVRTTELNRTDFSSEADKTRAEANALALAADLSRAEADLLIANLQIKRVEERLEQHIIRAPFSGIIIDKNAQPGEIVAPGSAGGGFTRTGICTIVDMNSLEIEVDVNESFIGRVNSGQKVSARLDAYPEWEIPARVIAIIPTANRDKATVQVRIGLEGYDERILPNMGVNVAFMKF